MTQVCVVISFVQGFTFELIVFMGSLLIVTFIVIFGSGFPCYWTKS